MFFPAWFSSLAAAFMPAPPTPAVAPTRRPPPAAHGGKILPGWLYKLAKIGHFHLANFTAAPTLVAPGKSRADYLVTAMHAAASLADISAHKPRGSYSSRYSSRRRVFNCAGFCYAKLFADHWFLPAVAVLGPYPLASDVALLKGFFAHHVSSGTFAVYATPHARHNAQILHISGSPRRVTYHPASKLTNLGRCVVGANPWPSLPPPAHLRFNNPGPSQPSANSQNPPAPRPPIPIIFPPRGPSVPPPVGPPPGPPHRSKGTRKPREPPKGVSTERKKKAPNRPNAAPAPYVPFHPYANERRTRGSPGPQGPANWKSAARDDFDDLCHELRESLNDHSRDLADSVWEDFKSWLADLKRSPSFSRSGSLPTMRTHFNELLSQALAALAAEEKRLEDLEQANKALGSLLIVIADLDKRFRDSETTDAQRIEIATALREARGSARGMEALIRTLSPEQVPDMTEIPDDAFAAQSSFIPVGGEDAPPPVAPWEEGNNDNFIARTTPLFPLPTGKVPLAELAFEMENPADSKFLLPRSLELYTAEELVKSTARGARHWLNRYEDPCEPLKPWSWDTMSRIYEKPGFRFLIARVAQLGPQRNDRKLQVLRAKLSERWGVPVQFESVDPRLDWMMGVIPSIDGSAKEILTTALIRLYDGNASYVIRHIGPVTKYRELDVEVKGQVRGPNQIFDQLKKRILELEASGSRLGFRVVSVRPSDAKQKFRISFILDRPTVSWNWTHKWGHPHGSAPLTSGFLNFKQQWRATKPYACRICYNSDHFSLECPLTRMKLGGVPIVSLASRDRVLHRPHPERLTASSEDWLAPRHPDPADAPDDYTGDEPPPPPPEGTSESSNNAPPAAPAPPTAPAPPQPNPPAPPVPPAPPAPSNPLHMDIDMPLVPPRAASLFSEPAHEDEDEDMDSALVEASSMYEFISSLVDDGPMPTSTYNLADIVTSCNGDIFTAWARVAAHYDSATLPELTSESLWLDYQAFKALPVDQEDQPADLDVPAVRVVPLLPHSLSPHLQDVIYVTHPHIAPVATPHETNTALPSDPPVSAAPVPVTAPSEACYIYSI